MKRSPKWPECGFTALTLACAAGPNLDGCSASLGNGATGCDQPSASTLISNKFNGWLNVVLPAVSLYCSRQNQWSRVRCRTWYIVESWAKRLGLFVTWLPRIEQWLSVSKQNVPALSPVQLFMFNIWGLVIWFCLFKAIYNLSPWSNWSLFPYLCNLFIAWKSFLANTPCSHWCNINYKCMVLLIELSKMQWNRTLELTGVYLQGAFQLCRLVVKEFSLRLVCECGMCECGKPVTDVWCFKIITIVCLKGGGKGVGVPDFAQF